MRDRQLPGRDQVERRLGARRARCRRSPPVVSPRRVVVVPAAAGRRDRQSARTRRREEQPPHARQDTPDMPSPFMELQVGERTVRVTNPDKVLFPARGETKLDLVRLLPLGRRGHRARPPRAADAAPPLPRRRRPARRSTRSACPQKRPDWIEVARVTFPSGRHADELCVTELAQVAWAANLAVVDFHPWPSRRADVDRPDELRIDVDPQPGTSFADGEARGRPRARGARRDRLHGLAEDLRQPRHPRRLPHRVAAGPSPRCAAARSPSPARSSAARPTS